MSFLSIPRRSLICQICNTRFLPEQEYQSILSHAGEALERRDFCIACWSKEAKFLHTDNILSSWRGQIPGKLRASEEKESKGKELQGFYPQLMEALESKTSEGLQQAFLLALFLERKRKLLFRKEIHDKNMIFRIYEAPGGEACAVPIPQEAIASVVSEEFLQLL